MTMTEITPAVFWQAWSLPIICVVPLLILDEIIWPLQDWLARRKEARRIEQEARKAKRKRI